MNCQSSSHETVGPEAPKRHCLQSNRHRPLPRCQQTSRRYTPILRTEPYGPDCYRMPEHDHDDILQIGFQTNSGMRHPRQLAASCTITTRLLSRQRMYSPNSLSPLDNPGDAESGQLRADRRANKLAKIAAGRAATGIAVTFSSFVDSFAPFFNGGKLQFIRSVRGLTSPTTSEASSLL